MIIILTGGTQQSRDPIITEISTLLPVEIYQPQQHNVLRSKIEISARTATNKLVVGCFLRSQRFELYNLARRFSVPYCVVYVSGECEYDCFEEPSCTQKYDSPLISEYTLAKILEVKTKTFIIKSHARKNAPTSDYMTVIKKVIGNVNKEFADHKYLLGQCEERFGNIVNMNPIKVCDIETTYRKIVEDEIKNKNIQ